MNHILNTKCGFGNVCLYVAHSLRKHGKAIISTRSEFNHDVTVSLIEEWLPDVELTDERGTSPEFFDFGDVYSWCKDPGYVDELRKGVFRKLVSDEEKEDAIAVHIRGTNFAAARQLGNFYLPTNEFVAEGLSFLHDATGFTDIHVFTDDPMRAALMYKDGVFDGYEVGVVDAASSPQLLLWMQQYPAMLRTSSTLSWLACVLGGVEHVVCNTPVEFNYSYANKQIFPSWKTIHVTRSAS